MDLYSELAGNSARARKRAVLALVLSVVLHLMLLFILPLAEQPAEATPIELTMLIPEQQAVAPRKPRIVSPSDAPEESPVRETNKLSEKDSRADVEQIQRGLERPADKTAPQQQVARADNATKRASGKADTQ